MVTLTKSSREKIKFLLVGAGNTALDFGLLFLLVALGLPSLVANFISTGSSMVVSFFLNKSFTFNDTSAGSRRQFLLFIVITLCGLWALQPLIILGVSALLSPLIESSSLLLFIAKIIATGGSLIWNYLLYSRIVFKKKGT